MTTRWDLPPTDLRVRLADVLEAWAPGGGIECHDLAEMDELLHLLDLHGVRAVPSDVKVTYLARDGYCALTFDSSEPEWAYRCLCGRWSTTRGDEIATIKDRWRVHVRAERSQAVSA